MGTPKKLKMRRGVGLISNFGLCRLPISQPSAGVVYGEKGRTWKYDPDFEPKEPCLRAGLRGDPYGKKPRSGRKHKDQMVFRPSLSDPIWKDVQQLLDKHEAPKDFLKLDMGYRLPDFPIESKKQNPYWSPGKYPTIRNAYYEQHKAIVEAYEDKIHGEKKAKKLRLHNQWKREHQRRQYFMQELRKVLPLAEEELDASRIDEDAKAL